MSLQLLAPAIREYLAVTSKAASPLQIVANGTKSQLVDALMAPQIRRKTEPRVVLFPDSQTISGK